MRLTRPGSNSAKTEFARVLSIGFLWAILAGFGGAGALAAESTVAIRDDFYVPKNLTIQPGDRVTWVQQGAETHTTTSSSNLWDSGVLHHGESFSLTFTNLGSFPYFCQVHGQSMSGKITVSEGPPPARNLFFANLSGKLRTTNEIGRLAVVSHKTKDFIEECAEESMRAEDDLALVYDVDADAVVAVDRSDGSTVCTVATFLGGVTLASPDGSQRERQAFVFLEDGDEANGSMIASERSTRGSSNELLKFSLHGSIQFGIHAYEDEPSQVFVGNFSTGRKFIPSRK